MYSAPRPHCIVFDIDGVVADPGHRSHFLRPDDTGWEEFFSALNQDPVLRTGATVAASLATLATVVWMSSRPERTRAATTTWLDQHGLPSGLLLLRRDDDVRQAGVVKAENLALLATSHDVALVVDDDPTIVRHLRQQGWPVLHADWLVYDSAGAPPGPPMPQSLAESSPPS